MRVQFWNSPPLDRPQTAELERFVTSSLRRKAFRVLPAFVICTAAFLPARGQDSAATLDNATHLLAHAFDDAKNAPMAASRDGGLIISALRSSRDKDLAPLFEK